MTRQTTGKGSTPKPKPTPATGLLLSRCMPFLGLGPTRIGVRVVQKGPKEGIEALKAAVPIINLLTEYKTPETAWKLMEELWFDNKSIGHLLTTVSGCQTMIRAALRGTGEPAVVFPPCYREYMPEFGELVDNISLNAWIRNALRPMVPVPTWIQPGLTRIVWRSEMKGASLADDFRSWLAGLRGNLVSLVGEAFSAWGDAVIPNGAYYIGSCPKCHKAFPRANNRQEYCSPSCRVGAMQDRKKLLLSS